MNYSNWAYIIVNSMTKGKVSTKVHLFPFLYFFLLLLLLMTVFVTIFPAKVNKTVLPSKEHFMCVVL
jgi:hypothetical protein